MPPALRNEQFIVEIESVPVCHAGYKILDGDFRALFFLDLLINTRYLIGMFNVIFI